METPRKGRPRSPETIERDEKIVELLDSDGPLSRNRIAERLGISRSLTSIAINRLKDTGRVRRCVDDEGQNVWTTKVEEPCP